MEKGNKKILITKIAVGLTIGSVLGVLYFNSPTKKNPDVNDKVELTTSQQTSLIEAQTELVKNNTKPKDIVADFNKRYDKLDKVNQSLATDLIYTSVQNASLYYNTASYVMAGEVGYSKGISSNALRSADGNKWVKGFLDESKEQYLTPYSLNAEFILMLPDFTRLEEEYGKGASKELSILLKAGKEAQKKQVFKDEEIDIYAAAEAYEIAMVAYMDILNEDEDSKYLQDVNSLARIYHDVLFGYVQTNNLKRDENNPDVYKLNKKSVADLKRVSKSNMSISKEAEDYLKLVNGKQEIKGSDLKLGMDKSISTYGTSVYWQSSSDVTTFLDQTLNSPKSDQSENKEKVDSNEEKEKE